MAQSTTNPGDFGSVQTRAKAVLQRQDDQSRPGRPYDLILAGGCLALVTFALILLIAKQTWIDGSMGESSAYYAIGILFPIHAFGLFAFSYGWELYDMPRALRLTIILALISVAAVALVIAVLTTLSRLKFLAGATDEASSFKTQPIIGALGSMGGGDGDNAEEQREREIMARDRAEIDRFGTRSRDWKPAAEPYLIHCQGCGETYTPVPPAAVCPFCGKAALSAG